MMPQDVVTLAFAMNACRSASAWQQSLALFEELGKFWVEANTVVTWNTRLVHVEQMEIIFDMVHYYYGANGSEIQ